MDRKIQKNRSRRRKPAKMFTRAWAVVVYRDDTQEYETCALHLAKTDAESEAREKSQQAHDDARYDRGAPYTEYFAVPVLGTHPQKTTLYPALKGEPGSRVLVLFRNEKDRNYACRSSGTPSESEVEENPASDDASEPDPDVSEYGIGLRYAGQTISLQ
jgi:hypothetical protein